VQFYETDEYLCNLVSNWIISGVKNGEAIILVASREHLAGIENHISSRTLRTLQESEQVTICDADETLKKFMGTDGLPIREKFFTTVGGLLKKALAKSPLVRVYGEMVNILWSQSNVDGTIALERLWNELSRECSFALLCGYSMKHFPNSQHSAGFQDVCGTHSRVLPAESYGTLHDPEAQMRLIAELQQRSMALQTEIADHRATENALLRSEDELKRSNEELRRANEELRLANEAAHIANNAKNIFLANISHELRTPLAGIVGFAELMLDPGLDGEERREATEVIVQNGRQLTRILNDILDLSKVECGSLPIELVKFSLKEWVADVSSVLGLLAREKGLSLNFDVEDPAVSWLITDPTRLRQILLNVVGNAIKFTDKGSVDVNFRILACPPPSPLLTSPRVSKTNSTTTNSNQTTHANVQTHVKSNNTHATNNTNTDTNTTTNTNQQRAILECTVTDSGPGISPEQAKRLFQPFTQGDSSISRRYGGTGLGLFLSRQLAQLLGGNLVLAESHPGKGSTFVCTVKVGIDKVEQTQQPPQQQLSERGLVSQIFGHPLSQQAAQNPISILVVDDNMVNRRLMVQVLKRMGYTNVQTAADGMLALKMVAETHFEVIFLDLQMPNMDGFSTCTAIRNLYQDQNRTPQPVLIALTAHAMRGDREHCLASGMDDFISKPINFGLLREKLAHYASSISEVAK